MIGGADDCSRPYGHLPAETHQPARSVHGDAVAQGAFLAKLQGSVRRVQVTAPAEADPVAKAHGRAALKRQPRAEAYRAAGREQRLPQDQTGRHAEPGGNPAQAGNKKFLDQRAHGVISCSGRAGRRPAS